MEEINVGIKVDDLGKKNQRWVVWKDKGGRLGVGNRLRPLKIVEIGLQIDRARVEAKEKKNTRAGWEERWGTKTDGKGSGGAKREGIRGESRRRFALSGMKQFCLCKIGASSIQFSFSSVRRSSVAAHRLWLALHLR